MNHGQHFVIRNLVTLRETQIFNYCNIIFNTLSKIEASNQENKKGGKNSLVPDISKGKKDKFQTKSKDTRKSITARLNPDDLPIFNQRLKLYGFDSLNALVHDFIKGKFPFITEDRQIDNLLSNAQSNGLKSLLEGGTVTIFIKEQIQVTCSIII